MHFLVILSLKTLWAGVKHWRTALHRFYVYRKPIDHLHDLAIWKWFKNVYISFDLKCICVWCLDNWSRILSSKPFNTFSMARLKTLQFRLILTPLFTATNPGRFAPITCSPGVNLPRVVSPRKVSRFAPLNRDSGWNDPVPTGTHAFFFSLFHHFFSWSVIGVVRVSSAVVFFLFSWPSIYVSYWFTVICEILKNGKF